MNSSVALVVVVIGVLAATVEFVAYMAGVRNLATEYVWASLMALAYFAITTVGSTAAYVELRRAREGGGEGLTAVSTDPIPQRPPAGRWAAAARTGRAPAARAWR